MYNTLITVSRFISKARTI